MIVTRQRLAPSPFDPSRTAQSYSSSSASDSCLSKSTVSSTRLLYSSTASFVS